MSDPKADPEIDLRRQIRAGLIANEVPAEHVDEIVDLSIHASREAATKLADIAATAQGIAKPLIVQIGAVLLEHRLRSAIEATNEWARENGKVVREVEFGVKVGGNA